jgi:hypothetical protein
MKWFCMVYVRGCISCLPYILEHLNKACSPTGDLRPQLGQSWSSNIQAKFIVLKESAAKLAKANCVVTRDKWKLNSAYYNKLNI